MAAHRERFFASPTDGLPFFIKRLIPSCLLIEPRVLPEVFDNVVDVEAVFEAEDDADVTVEHPPNGLIFL